MQTEQKHWKKENSPFLWSSCIKTLLKNIHFYIIIVLYITQFNINPHDQSKNMAGCCWWRCTWAHLIELWGNTKWKRSGADELDESSYLKSVWNRRLLCWLMPIPRVLAFILTFAWEQRGHSPCWARWDVGSETLSGYKNLKII